MHKGNLQPTLELESENQPSSRLGQSTAVRTMIGFDQKNRTKPYEEEDYEQIFSDTDGLSSRLFDSILERYGQQLNKHSILFKESLIEKNLCDTKTDLNFIQKWMRNPNFMSVLSQDKTTNDSFLHIIHELDSENVKRAADENGYNQQSIANDSQTLHRKYQETLEMMNYLRNQLSLQDSLPNSKKQLIEQAAPKDSRVPQNKLQDNQQFRQQQVLSPPRILLTSPTNADQIKNQTEKRQQIDSCHLHLPGNQKVLEKTPIRSKLISVPNGFTSTDKIYETRLTGKNENLPDPRTPQKYPIMSSRYQSSETRKGTMSSRSEPDRFNQFTSQRKLDFFQEQQEILNKTEINLRQNSNQHDPFEKQKRMEAEIISQINYDTLVKEDLPVFCINCEEYVHLQDINSHADSECITNQQNKIKINRGNSTQNQLFLKENTNEGELQIINEKIASIEYQLIQRRNQQKRGNNESLLIVSIMESSIVSAGQLKANGLTLDEINQILKQINLIKAQITGIPTSSQLGNISLRILWDRLLILGQEKASSTGFQRIKNQKVNELNLGVIPTAIVTSLSTRESSKGIEFNRNKAISGYSTSPSSASLSSKNTLRAYKYFDLSSNQRINSSTDLQNKHPHFQVNKLLPL